MFRLSFADGAIAPVFFLFCVEIGLSGASQALLRLFFPKGRAVRSPPADAGPHDATAEWDVGFLLTLILVGDLFVTLYLSTSADAFGRRRILVIGSCLKARGLPSSRTLNHTIRGPSGHVSPGAPAHAARLSACLLRSVD